MPAPIPMGMSAGTRTSEFKVTLLSMAATVLTAGLKAAGVAALASGQWWAVPISAALASVGYSLSRGLAKRGIVVPAPPAPPPS